MLQDDENKNIIKFSAKKHSSVKENAPKPQIKSFQGFNYIKEDKDLNGTPFIKENLSEYSLGCKYIVRVMREKNGKVYLYSYYVSQEDLASFLTKIENGEFDGRLIEVEKYIPEELA